MQSRCYIHALAVTIFAFDDHFSQIDSNSNFDAFAFGHARIALDHAALESNRTFDSIDNAAEFRQQTVPHQLEDAPMVLLDLRLEQLLSASPHPVKSSRFVRLHMGRVTHNVGGKDGRKLAFHCNFHGVPHR